jgi:hypothetical protein
MCCPRQGADGWWPVVCCGYASWKQVGEGISVVQLVLQHACHGIMRACAYCSVIMGFPVDFDFDQCLWKKCEVSSIFDQDI